METILQLQNPHWSGLKHVTHFQRAILPALIKKLQLKEIQILLGIRRSGKSTIFKLLIDVLCQQIEPKSILYINLDDPFFADVWKDPKAFYQLIETSEKLTGHKVTYLFLDEVQNVKNWQKFVKSAYDSEIFKKIFVTGSNSQLLKNHYARLLSGRYIIDYVFPLNFQEILWKNHIEDSLTLIQEKPKVLRLLEELLYFGSFPEVLKITDKELKRELLINYYETIVLKDCIANYNIRDTQTFRELGLYLATNNASVYSYNSIAKALNSNENTIKEFISIFSDSFLIDEIKNFSFFFKKQIKTKKKTFYSDNGLIYATAFRFSENKGKMLENLVYTEFKKMGGNEIFIYNDEIECDFIIKQNNTFFAVQVCYDLNKHNKNREITALKIAMETFKINRGYIITFNQEEKISSSIQVIPFWKFFPH